MLNQYQKKSWTKIEERTIDQKLNDIRYISTKDSFVCNDSTNGFQLKLRFVINQEKEKVKIGHLDGF